MKLSKRVERVGTAFLAVGLTLIVWVGLPVFVVLAVVTLPLTFAQQLVIILFGALGFSVLVGLWFMLATTLLQDRGK